MDFEEKDEDEGQNNKRGAFEFEAFELDFPDEDDESGSESGQFEKPVRSSRSRRRRVSSGSISNLDDDMDDLDFNADDRGVLDGDYNDYVMMDDDAGYEGSSRDASRGSRNTMRKSNFSTNRKRTIRRKKVNGEELDDLFDGFCIKEKEGDDVKLSAENLEHFLNLNYEEIAETLCSFDYETRMKIKEYLLKKEFNILAVIHKEATQDVRIIFFGLFSPRPVFHTLMCKKAITDCNVNLLLTIFALKPKWIIDSIIETYKKIYEVELEDEINKNLQPMNELIICFINSEKYFHFIDDSEYYKEAERVLNIIKSQNITGFINFLVRFKPKCFHGICAEFYHRYGYTVMNYVRKFIKEDDIINMFELLHFAYFSPVFFYAKLINSQITSCKPDITLPYVLIDLKHNGLDTVMVKYQMLYDKFNLKKLVHRFEPGIKQFVSRILSKYDNWTENNAVS